MRRLLLLAALATVKAHAGVCETKGDTIIISPSCTGDIHEAIKAGLAEYNPPEHLPPKDLPPLIRPTQPPQFKENKSLGRKLRDIWYEPNR